MGRGKLMLKLNYTTDYFGVDSEEKNDVGYKQSGQDLRLYKTMIK